MPFEVLIVDDDPSHRAHVGSILNGAGGKVREESSRTGALNVAPANPFDLIVLKTDLPEMSRATIESLSRKDRANAPLAVIGVAPTVSPAEIRSYVRAGLYAVLPRPVQAWRLREMVYLLGLAERPLSTPSESQGVMSALASEDRLKIYGAIARRGSVASTSLESDMGVSRQNLKHHLKDLLAAGLIVAEKHGRAIRYSVRARPVYAAAHRMLDMADRPDAYAPALV